MGFDGAAYSSACEVYSFGMVIWEVVTGQVPFQGMTDAQTVRSICNDQRPPIPPRGNRLLCDLAQRCWRQDPTQRCTFSDVLEQLEAAASAYPTPGRDAVNEIKRRLGEEKEKLA